MTSKHFKKIDALPCLICGGRATHHHLLRVDREYLPIRAGEEEFLIPKKKSKGMGTKSDDRFCLPLCPIHHAEAHARGNDKQYLIEHGIYYPEELALKLYAADLEGCKKILRGLVWTR